MNSLIIKIVLGVVLLGGIGAGGYIKGLKDQPEVKVSCPKCPDVTCPPTLGTDFDKIKSKNVTLNLNQNYEVEMNGDSLVLKRIEEIFRRELKELKISRCK